MSIKNDLFINRNLLIASKHQKEEVIAPLVEKVLGVKTFVPKVFDTDSLGTFSGEIERKESALDTLRTKCLEAMNIEGYDLAIATEGSFGNHPSIFFASANDELIMLKDLKNNIEIVERVLSLETNFYSSRVNTLKELKEILENIGFPMHRVILKASESDFENMIKGINDEKQLLNHFQKFLPINGYCFIETDMRACYNPKRMKVIEEATIKLMDKIKSLCPECSFPGFGIEDIEAGLPCSWCKEPTNSTLAHIYKCKKCKYESKIMYPKGKKYEDPMYCNECNP